MSHKDVLKLLFPLELGGVFEADTLLEGKHLDDAEASADLLLREMLPQSATDSIADWERVCGVVPDDTDTLQIRQARVVSKLRERGGLSIPHFMALAASWGYSVVIEELLAGTDGLGDEGIFRWRVTFTATPLYYFRSGQSRAGERLVYGPLASAMEGLFTDIKPAHTQVIFAYA
ncbi:MAG: DUF2313 domain-containing protein [Deltaproteobacteria bacterium]|nr:DUF2313 domain-containing protein [Deltaproteobacteria bacterium]